MRTVKVLFLVVLVLIVFQQIGHAEIYCKIKGRVIDSETREGIPNVYVNAHRFEHDNPKDYFVMTDTKGYFTFSNLLSGRYEICYNPLYPYVALPDQEHFRAKWENSFLIKKGEVKYIEQKLVKGGEIVLKYNLPIGIDSEYSWDDLCLYRIEEDVIKRNIITIAHKWKNPEFKKASDGFKICGLAPGEYLISRSLKKKSQYYSGDDVEYAGLVRLFKLEKLESKTLVLDYTSASRVNLNIKDKNGNKFHRGCIDLYKEIVMNNKTGFCQVWEHSYQRNEVVNPIIIEQGKYFIAFDFGGELIGSDGSVIEFPTNGFLVNIEEGEIKELNLVISLNERLFPEINFL